MLSAVLVDVGGTLWPDLLTDDRSDDPILARLAKLLPDIAPAESLAALRAALREDDRSPVQDTLAVLGSALRTLGPAYALGGLDEIRRALCAPAAPGVALFPGAREFLDRLRSVQTFSGIDELKRQLQQDILAAAKLAGST